MPTLLSRRAAILFKVEGTEGVDAGPLAADGMLVENVRCTLNPNIVETNEVTPSLDPFDPIVGGMSATIEFDVYMKGSGAAATAPEWGRMLKCCGYSETITATAVPAAPEACAAGGSTTMAVLGVTAAATSQLYRGMPVNLTGTVGMLSFIYDYGTVGKQARLTDTGTGAIVATTSYQILPNVLYVPASSSVSSGTIYFHNDGLLYKFLGCRGTVVFNTVSGGPSKASFRFMGMFGSKTDVALPTAIYDATRPPIWKGGAMTINSVAAAAGTLNLDTGNQLVQPDNPNSPEGFDPAIITIRQLRGTLNPKETLTGTRDIMGDFRTQTRRPLHARFGITAGNRIGFTVPAALYLNETYGDNNGYRIVDVPFDMTGQDSGMSICCF